MNDDLVLENNGETKLGLVSINYSEKKQGIVATIKTVIDGREVASKPITDLDKIESILYSLSKQVKMSISDLVDKKEIVVNEKLLNEGVIILNNDKHYRRCFFNKNTGVFDKKPLARMEARALGIFSDDEMLDFADTKTELIETPSDVYDKPVIEESHETFEDLPLSSVENVVNTEEVDKVKVVSDGAIDISDRAETIVSTNEKKAKDVKNIKVFKRAFALLGAAAVVLVGSSLFSRKNNSKTYDNHDNNTRIETQDNYDSNTLSYHEEVDLNGGYQPVDNESTLYVENNNNYDNGDMYSESGSMVSTVSMQDQIQYINQSCASLNPFDFYDMVIESDRQAIRTICDARNMALENKDYVIDVIDQYVKYIFEGTTMFNGNVVKSYDYLTPYAKYIVLASGQTLLSLCKDYNYSTMNGIYTYDDLVDSFDNYVDQVYRELINKSKTY